MRHLDIFVPRSVLYPTSSKTLAVEASPSDLALCLIIDIGVILGEGVAPHHVLLVTVIPSCITINSEINKINSIYK